MNFCKLWKMDWTTRTHSLIQTYLWIIIIIYYYCSLLCHVTCVAFWIIGRKKLYEDEIGFFACFRTHVPAENERGDVNAECCCSNYTVHTCDTRYHYRKTKWKKKTLFSAIILLLLPGSRYKLKFTRRRPLLVKTRLIVLTTRALAHESMQTCDKLN